MAAARREITGFFFVLSAVCSVASAAAQHLEPETARVPARIEIDRSAISIDVAAQRRLLGERIRGALDAKASARPAAEESRLATAADRPRG